MVKKPQGLKYNRIFSDITMILPKSYNMLITKMLKPTTCIK